ncbi:MAG: response regulator transcription factor [Cytophagaceae bacterium]|jgi:DNA-binding NarL/FixJ family response regulator|nr:response regulator transcription factor [Cytophagaceae bacterium]
MKMIQVVLVDDHSIVRDGVRATLKDQKNIKIIGEASNGKDAVKLVSELEPDVVIMDIAMPEMNGIEATDLLTKKKIQSKVIILSMHDNETYVLKSVEAGAMGYLLKDVDKEEFVKAINVVASGEKYFNTTISTLLVNGYLNKVKQGELKTSEDESEGEFDLTKRERGILKMIVDGRNNREIADGLGISVRTIETHRANIMKKLKVKNAVELVKVAIEEKIV